MNNPFCDAMPLGVLAIGLDQRIRYWNRWLHEHTGIRADAAVGQRLQELYPAFRNPRFELAVEQSIKGHGPQILSQALHHYLIPIEQPHLERHGYSLMRQQIHIQASIMDGEAVALVCLIDVTAMVMRAGALTDVAQRLEQDVNRDPLTGLYNRRFMWEWLEHEFKQAARHEYLIAAMMIDLDGFKPVNDRYGHQVGDRVLQRFADILLECTRESDVVVRYGGDEFVLFLPGCDRDKANEVGQRIMATVAQTHFDGAGVGEIGCSIGIALSRPDNSILPTDLVNRADERLYRAKEIGSQTIISREQ